MSTSPVTDHSSPTTASQLNNANSPASPVDLSGIGSFSRRFIIPTRTNSLSSGFPYHPRLHDMNVSLDEWHLFTSAILEAGKPTLHEDYAAWSTGVATGTLATPFILFFGPWAGYAAGKPVHKKVVVSKVKERLLRDGDMRSVLRQWNEGTFAVKGFQAWLELPVEGDLGDLHPNPGVKETKTKKEEKAEKKEKRRLKIVIIAENDKQVTFPYHQNQTQGSPSDALVQPFRARKFVSIDLKLTVLDSELVVHSNLLRIYNLEARSADFHYHNTTSPA
ncbi:hypothetical protein D0Z07_8244 [Hyphodiscus hymeniophilus]|uniref:Uncharacterized protein n=1 Tax=Hyphodiscus hymeniophilus TaxID=353542 RepID=A0A9P7AU83_9HELO|nr:hypothetical protein D0Z07_8244 [Hyphodiscus hymeniophilus]